MRNARRHRCILADEPMIMIKDEIFDVVLKPQPRIEFDPYNSEHREAYVNFELTGRWSIHFKIEWPSVTVPQTILKKIAAMACDEEFKRVKARLNAQSK